MLQQLRLKGFFSVPDSSAAWMQNSEGLLTTGGHSFRLGILLGGGGTH